ncbi:glycosyltransferase [Methanobacterium oryzae]|uniref:glycosyltransferase n=1 Tax=Methanobacterium oryzae TaxID=69540 RepID=UPI003D24B2D1
MRISVIIPMYNEEENVINTLKQVKNVLKDYRDYEIIVIDDGSQDNTFKLLHEFTSANSKVHVLKHSTNMGMGKALITGFKKAEGDIIITLDADLSYNPLFIPKLIHELDDENIDIIIGSQYMAGGKTDGIPLLRLFISKMANKIVGYAIADDISTVTGILRAYRKEVLDSIEIDSNGTEINPEILAKAKAIGFNIKEIPVVLEGRKLGESKIKIKSTTISHLLFTFNEKPIILFGAIGVFLLFIGLTSALYLFYQYLIGTLDPKRPLMLFMVLMILSGIQVLVFGFVATQISLLKKEIYVIQKENKGIRKELKKQ